MIENLQKIFGNKIAMNLQKHDITLGENESTKIQIYINDLNNDLI